jgi:2-methylcitrate dehydratase PrpD
MEKTPFAPFAIGETLAVLDPGLHVKLYPSCALSHRILDIVLHLTSVHNLPADQVQKVRCRATRKAEQILVYGKPSSPLEGKFSIPFLVAVALLDGAAPTGAFSEKTLHDAKVLQLMARVDFRVHEDWDEVGDDRRPDIVEIELLDGQSLRGQAVYPRGHANNPLSMDEMRRKFIACTGGVLPPDQGDRLYSDLLALDSLADVREIFSKLSYQAEK